MKALIALTITFALYGCGITAAHGGEGYADLGSVKLNNAKHVMSFSIGPGVIGLARRFNDDPESEEILQSVRGLRIKIYELQGETEDAIGQIKALAGELAAQDWSPVVVVQEESEHVQILVQANDDVIKGLAILAVDRTEAVLINVIGDIKPESFGKTLDALDVDVGVELTAM